jgi:hypothetical protein
VVGLFGALLLLAPSLARAQLTGGSFGSSDWGDDSSGSSSSGSSGSSWGSSSGSSWGSTSSSDDDFYERVRRSSPSSRDDEPWWSSRQDRHDPWIGSTEPERSSSSDSSPSRSSYDRPSGASSGFFENVGFYLFVGFLLIAAAVILGGPLVLFGLAVHSMGRSKRRLLLDDGEPIRVYVPPPRTSAPRAGSSVPRSASGSPSSSPPAVVHRPSAPRAQSSQLGVVVLHAGLDARARKPVQDALGTLATTLAPGPEGRLRALHATLALLDTHATSIAYEGTRTHAHLPQVEARGVFARETAELRARFRYELVRADASHGASPSSATPIATPALRPRAEEGEGFVVVSLVVAARGLVAPTSGFDPTAAALVRLDAEQLVAFEVIWSPAADADRMSSLELETLYPELRAVRHDVGRVRCVCGVPYAAELASCPSCGRPVAEALRVG